jgi:DNA repair protein RAD16
VATTALRREMQRTQKKISDIEQREVKTKQKELQKKLKRKLTQGERNAIALHEHHPELKTLWGDLEAGPSCVSLSLLALDFSSFRRSSGSRN